MAIGGSDLSLLFKLKGEADLKSAQTELKSVERQIASLKDRIKEVKAEGKDDIGFKPERIKALQSSLKDLNTQHKQLKETQTQAKRATEEFSKTTEDLSGALTAVSPRLGSVVGALTGAAGPLTVVGLGMAAVAASVVALHKGLFDLAVSAADFRGKLLDMSQQTGVSVETLSALEVAAARVGTSIEGIVAPLGIFQRHLDEAQDPASKMAQKFRELGVETNNTEDALRQTLAAVAAMPEGFRQTSLALELFGRGGRTFLAILKETDGDLDALIGKLRELGVVVSEEDARAADEFNDQLAILQFQMRGLLGKEVIPAALEGLKDFSRFLKDNKQDIDAVAKAIGTLSTVLGTTFKISLSEVAGIIRAANRPYIIWADTLTRIVKSLEYLKGNLPALSTLAPAGGVRGFDLQPENVGGGETNTRTHQTITQKEIEQLAALKKAQQELAAESEKRIEFVQRLAGAQKPLRDQLQGINVETHRYAVEQSILNGILKDGSEGEKEQARRIATKLDNLEKQLKLQNQLADFLKKQAEQVRLVIEGEKGQIQLAEEFIKSLEKEGAVLQESTKQLIIRQAAILANVEAIKALAESVERLPPLLAGEGGGAGLSEDAIGALAGAAADASAGLPPALRQFNELTPQVIASIDSMRDAFGGLGSAVGQAVQAFVLFGSAGTSFRKFTAEVLASVAAQSATKAIFELAEGLAMLALTYFTGNPKYAASAGAHFASAAMYGAIAGASAAAGRGVASGAFTNAGGGAGGSGGSSGSVQPLQTIVQGRNQPQQPRITIRLVSDLGELKKVIVANVVEDYVDGGDTREVISRDGH